MIMTHVILDTVELPDDPTVVCIVRARKAR